MHSHILAHTYHTVMHVHLCTHTYLHACTYMHNCMYTCTHTYMHTNAHMLSHTVPHIHTISHTLTDTHTYSLTPSHSPPAPWTWGNQVSDMKQWLPPALLTGCSVRVSVGFSECVFVCLCSTLAPSATLYLAQLAAACAYSCLYKGR